MNLNHSDSCVDGSSNNIKHVPENFETFFPWVCNQLEVTVSLNIIKLQQAVYLPISKKDKGGQKEKPERSLNTSQQQTNVSASAAQMSTFVYGEECITIYAVYDVNENLVQIKFDKNHNIPDSVFKVLTLIMPYYRFMTNLSINSGIGKSSIHEINKFIGSSITEICFDGTRIPDANYELILENENCLTNLSLSRCDIEDETLKRIASKLTYPLPASKTLSLLNLSSNKISDVGVKHIAEALKSNRRLVYLNLASNWITDEGAQAILNVLTQFQLSVNELKSAKARKMEYCKEKLAHITKTNLIERTIEDKKNKKKVTLKSKITIVYEDFKDPFSESNTLAKDGSVYCYGNNLLAYLNISYNNISYITVKKLLNVLMDQKFLNRNPKGLINVSIEGNCLPADCVELRKINEILLKTISKCTLSKKSTASKKR